MHNAAPGLTPEAMAASIRELQTANQQLVSQMTEYAKEQEAKIATLKHSAAPRGIKPPNPQIYAGRRNEDVRAWLFHMEEQLNLYQVALDQRVAFAGSCMTGAALTWYRSVRDCATPITDWHTFAAKLREEFMSINPKKQARDQLAALTQTGDVRGYTAAFRRIITACGGDTEVPPKEQFDRYIRGLRPKTRKEVEHDEPANLQAAIVAAEKADNHFARVSTFDGGSSGYNRSRYFTRDTRKSDPMILGTMNGRGKENYRPGPMLSQAERDRRMAQGLCLDCGKPGHRRMSCPDRRPAGDYHGGTDQRRHQGNGRGTPR